MKLQIFECCIENEYGKMGNNINKTHTGISLNNGASYVIFEKNTIKQVKYRKHNNTQHISFTFKDNSEYSIESDLTHNFKIKDSSNIAKLVKYLIN